MTLPHERLRSIHGMRELLAHASVLAEIPETMRNRAACILAQYPSELELYALIEVGGVGLPLTMADILIAAHEWLEDLARQQDLSSDVVRFRLWVARHFPSVSSINQMRMLFGQAPTVLNECIQHWVDRARFDERPSEIEGRRDS